MGYAVRRGKALLPTEKGIRLIEVVPDELKSPETTGKWEKALERIAKGAMDPERFMGSIVRYVDYIVKEAAARKKDIVFPREPYRSGKKTGRKKGEGKKTRQAETDRAMKE